MLRSAPPEGVPSQKGIVMKAHKRRRVTRINGKSRTGRCDLPPRIAPLKPGSRSPGGRIIPPRVIIQHNLYCQHALGWIMQNGFPVPEWILQAPGAYLECYDRKEESKSWKGGDANDPRN